MEKGGTVANLKKHMIYSYENGENAETTDMWFEEYNGAEHTY